MSGGILCMGSLVFHGSSLCRRFFGQKSEVFVWPTRKRGAAVVRGCFWMQTSERCIPPKGAEKKGIGSPNMSENLPRFVFFNNVGAYHFLSTTLFFVRCRGFDTCWGEWSLDMFFWFKMSGMTMNMCRDMQMLRCFLCFVSCCWIYPNYEDLIVSVTPKGNVVWEPFLEDHPT